MRFATAAAPHVFGGYSVPRVMYTVLLALVPYAVVLVMLHGPAPLLQLAIAAVTALACEALALRLRRRDARPYLRDGSVLVTAALLALALPPTLPLWMTVLGTAIAVLLAKHAFGGLGFNPFNPAMVGYAALLVGFPAAMGQWPAPAGASFDAYTGATALTQLRGGLDAGLMIDEVLAQPGFGRFGGAGAEWLNVAALFGGAILLLRGVIRWQIPVGMLAGLVTLSLLTSAIAPDRYAGPMLQLFSGATMLGAFFIATDPVSAATSDRGRLLFGLGIGVLTCVIRCWGAHPDGVAFAVLLLNLCVPAIDRCTVPRIHGDRKR